jgi:hypothetical protein
MLLHFSLVISRLADQNKLMAQRLGLLQQRVLQLEDRLESEVPRQSATEAELEPRDLTPAP